MADDRNQVLKQFRLSRIIWPVLIGLGVLIFAIYKIWNEDLTLDQVLQYTTLEQVLLWVFIGFLFMVIRDIGYIWRMRIMTDGQLNLRAAFEVALLWESASAFTPSVVGGSAVAIFMLVKEKISAGRSMAIIFVTIFLDEVFYLVMLPISLVLIGHTAAFSPLGDGSSTMGMSLILAFWVAYGILFAYTLFLAFAIFIRPEGTNRVFKRLFKTRLFRRWEDKGDKFADDIMIASREFRDKPFMYWAKAFGATFLAWMGRYLVLNCVLLAFTVMTYGEHVIAFARQAILFVVMIVSPTPGSSGVAETGFTSLFSEFSPASIAPEQMAAFMLVLATLWRLISYYPYIILGLILLPRWVRRVYGRPKAEAAEAST